MRLINSTNLRDEWRREASATRLMLDVHAKETSEMVRRKNKCTYNCSSAAATLLKDWLTKLHQAAMSGSKSVRNRDTIRIRVQRGLRNDRESCVERSDQAQRAQALRSGEFSSRRPPIGCGQSRRLYPRTLSLSPRRHHLTRTRARGHEFEYAPRAALAVVLRQCCDRTAGRDDDAAGLFTGKLITLLLRVQ